MELSQVMVKFLLFVFWLLWLTTCSSSTSKWCSSYTFSSEPKNWEESNKNCEQDRGHLVSMETEQEYEFINKTIQGRDEGDNEWFIGLRNNEKTREKIKGWKWNTGYKLTIDKWRPGQPNEDGHCVKMIKYYRGSYGLFDDLRCDIQRMFICEYKVSLEIAGQTDTFCSDINDHAKKPIPRPTSSIQRSTTKTITPATTKTTTLITTTTTTTTTAATTTAAAASTTTAKTLTKTKEMVIRNGKWTKSSPSTGLYITSVPNTTIPVMRVPQPFPIMVVVIVLAILLVISICTFTIAFFWLKEKSGNAKSRSKLWESPMISTPIAEEENCLPKNSLHTGPSTTEHMQSTEPDLVLYAEIDDIYLQPSDTSVSVTHTKVEYANSPSPTTSSGYAKLLQNPVHQNQTPYQPLNKYPDEEEEEEDLDEIAI